jgi:hypothetical protein
LAVSPQSPQHVGRLRRVRVECEDVVPAGGPQSSAERGTETRFGGVDRAKLRGAFVRLKTLAHTLAGDNELAVRNDRLEHTAKRRDRRGKSRSGIEYRHDNGQHRSAHSFTVTRERRCARNPARVG